MLRHAGFINAAFLGAKIEVFALFAIHIFFKEFKALNDDLSDVPYLLR